MDAIQIGGFKDDEIKGQIQNFVGSANNEPNILAFCCQNSAFEAGKMAEAFNMPLPAGLRIIKVPCAGKIDIDYILSAFVNGADGVLVMTCHNGNCKSEQGNIFANRRVGHVHRMFEETGFENDRLKYVTLASNMGQDFSLIVTDMETKIKELGPNPLKN
jgi:coenzyme F420-reducing hydrogenase delta subunit